MKSRYFLYLAAALLVAHAALAFWSYRTYPYGTVAPMSQPHSGIPCCPPGEPDCHKGQCPPEA